MIFIHSKYGKSLIILTSNTFLPVGDSCMLTWAVDRKPDALKDFSAVSDEAFTLSEAGNSTQTIKLLI